VIIEFLGLSDTDGRSDGRLGDFFSNLLGAQRCFFQIASE